MTDATETTVLSIPFRAFHNAIRIMWGLDEHELLEAGVQKHNTRLFMADPAGFFVRACDADKAAIWAAVQKRQPQVLRPAPALLDALEDTIPTLTAAATALAMAELDAASIACADRAAAIRAVIQSTAALAREDVAQLEACA